jgi:ABC-type branched-subunit amino acid transport system ATPase component
VLEVKGLEVAYGHARALLGVDLTLDPGEMVFIVGRNGAGKTTLLKTICGLMAPRRGEIVFDGRSIAGLTAEKVARLGISYVAQDKRVFRNLSVQSNIELAAHAQGRDLEEATAELIRLYPKMGDLLDHRAGDLSGGQREILLIGRALVTRPRLLLIDEPTEGLAAVVIEDIFRILTQMKQSLAAIIVEQNLSVVSRLADRVYVMKEGRTIAHVSDPALIADTRTFESQL